MIKLLMVDDDIHIQKALKFSLTDEGFALFFASSVQQAIKDIEKEVYDIILLDVNLPDGSGLDIIQHMRNLNIHTPTLFISGKQEEYIKIMSLSMGADDYITKPFSTPMLIAKIRAILRRENLYKPTLANVLECGEFKFFQETLSLYKKEDEINLSSKEMSLIKYFMENKGSVLTKEQIYQHVWNHDVVDDNTIMVYIKRLRNKLEEDPKQPKHLKTVWGIGYKLED